MGTRVLKNQGGSEDRGVGWVSLGIHAAALARHKLSSRSLVTVVSKAETSPGGFSSCGTNINQCWRKCCLQREREEARANRWFAALLILNPWYLTHRKAAGNLTILKGEAVNNSRLDESWWQLLYTAKMGKVGIIRAVPPLKVLKSLLLETPDLRETILRSAGSRRPLLIYRSRDMCRRWKGTAVQTFGCLCQRPGAASPEIPPSTTGISAASWKSSMSSTWVVWVLQLPVVQQ